VATCPSLTRPLDMWSHQYLQQMNQIWVQNMGNNPFATDGGYSNVMGLQPNYPCCTVNHPQGFPKFISNAFVTAHAGAALVQVYLAPVSVRTTLAGSNGVNVTVATNYPFADTLHVTTSAQKAYTHYVRVPEWAKRAGQATIALNGAAAKTLKPNADSLFAVAVPRASTRSTCRSPRPSTSCRAPSACLSVADRSSSPATSSGRRPRSRRAPCVLTLY
jgi:hypothetical protein